jgi:nucleoside-triphosphatase THEP1
MKVLVTAPPGTGKSTLMRAVVDSLNKSRIKSCKGVLCVEQRDPTGTRRIGFTAVLSDGRSKDFMIKEKKKKHHTEISEEKEFSGDQESKEEVRVGAYVVQLNVIEEFVVPYIKSLANGSRSDNNLIFIDEIGRAQSFSSDFLNTVDDILQDPEQCVLASIVHAETEWSQPFKELDSVWLVEVTLENRDFLPPIIVSMFTNINIIQSLSECDQLFVKNMFFELLKCNMFKAAKKLLSNTIKYVLEGRIVESREESRSGGMLSCFEVRGDTHNHVVQEIESAILVNNSNIECQEHANSGDGISDANPIDSALHQVDRFLCDCPLFLGLPPFAGQSQICSHILAVRLFLHQTSSQQV